jgi:hypothetical protein
MKLEDFVQLSLILLFLIFAYFMIGGYTPCPERYYPLNSSYNQRSNEYMSCTDCDDIGYAGYGVDRSSPRSIIPEYRSSSSGAYPVDKNIYQMGPYLNF